MQKLLIIVLVLALGGGAFLSKPSDPKKSFTDFLTQKATQNDNSVLSGAWDTFKVTSYANSCDYKDRIFWVSVVKDGQTVYVNAFTRWFNRAEIKQTVQTDIEKAREKAAEGADQLNKTKDQLQNLTH